MSKNFYRNNRKKIPIQELHCYIVIEFRFPSFCGSDFIEDNQF